MQDRRISYVALGHIHKHQVLSQNPLVVYSGSPVRIDFGEEKEDKGVCLVTIDDSKKATMEFLPTDIRKFCTISITLKEDDPDPTTTVLQEIKKFECKDKIVRVILNIPADLQKEIEMEKIKKSLVDSHVIAGISRNIERKERLRIEGIEETERLTPLEALKKYFDAKKLSVEKQTELQKLAENLLEN